MSSEGQVTISQIYEFVKPKSAYQRYVYVKELLAGLVKYEGRLRANMGPRMNNVTNQNLHCFALAAIIVMEEEEEEVVKK